MPAISLILLPGLDGSGLLFRPFVACLPRDVRPIVVAYPPDRPLDYDALLPIVLDAVPADGPFAILGESFSGPLALMAAARAPARLRSVVLCASFVRNPLPIDLGPLRHLVRGACFRATPAILRDRALLGRRATPALRHALADALGMTSPHVIAHRVRSVLRVDVRDALRRCPVPTLYLRATHDRIVGRRSVRDVLAARPPTRVVELPAPHLLLQTEPASAAAAVASFVRPPT